MLIYTAESINITFRLGIPSLEPDIKPYPVRPARLATTATNSFGLIGFGT